jgi:hypothetical protein
MSSRSSCPGFQDCTAAQREWAEREWEKVELAKKRLALVEYLKAEKKKLKVKKLALKQDVLAKHNDWTEKEYAYQKRMRELEEKAAAITQQQQQQQLHQANGKNQQQEDKMVLDLQSRLDELSLEHKKDLEDCRNSLTATQKALAELFVERDVMKRDRDGLAEQLQTASTSSYPEQSEKIQGLERELQQLKALYASAQAMHASEKRKMEEQSSICGDAFVSVVDDDEKLQELRHENQVLCERQRELMEELETQQAIAQRQMILVETHEQMLKEKETQWESQRRLLQRQTDDLKEEIRILSLQLPRNAILLEQERLKNEELEGDLQVAQNKKNHLEVELLEFERTANQLQKSQAQELQQIKEDNEKLVRERAASAHTIRELESLIVALSEGGQDIKSNRRVDSSISSSGQSSSSNGNRFMAVIPSDLQSSGSGQMAGESRGRHVAELDWEGRELSGKFTGWLDSDGNPDGHGTLRMEDESVYDGEWRHGEWNGTLIWT